MRDSVLNDALAAAHAAGLVHRDLKPANLLARGTVNYGVKRVAAGIADLRELRDLVGRKRVPGIFAIDFGVTTSHASLLDWEILGRAPRMPSAIPDLFSSTASSGFFPLDRIPRAGARPRDLAAGALLTRLRANPVSLFAVSPPGPPDAAPRKAAARVQVWDLGREGLLRFLNIILAAFSLVFILLLAALAHRPAALAFTLLLVAVARRFGRRSETDDVLVPARQSLSAVAGRRPERQ